MFPWLRRSLRSDSEPLNLEDALEICLSSKDTPTFKLQERDLLYQVHDVSHTLKDAKALAENGHYAEATDAFGEHFTYRTQPQCLMRHSPNGAIGQVLLKAGKEQKAYIKYGEGLLEQGRAILRHTFQLSGMAPYTFKKNIDWFSDFTGHSWPRLSFNEIKRRLESGEPLSNSCQGSIHTTWEFNRHAHFVTLGRAYWISGNESFAAEFIVEAIKWYQENPPLMGVNWYDPQTVATRAINWILALNMFMESEQLQFSQVALLVEALLVHGVILERWLRQSKDKPSLAVATALFLLTSWIPEARYASKWMSLSQNACAAALKQELNQDYLHKSLSIPQHRLCCEWLLLQVLQYDLQKMRPPEYVERSLVNMLEALQNCLASPQHLVNLGGDFPDPGFMGQGCSAYEHTCNLLALGAVLLQRAELYVGLPPHPPELLWWLGEQGWLDLDAAPFSRAPIDFGVYGTAGVGVARSSWDDNYSHLVFRAPATNTLPLSLQEQESPKARLNFHNDALSFSLTVNGIPFILEPGLALCPEHHDARLSCLNAHSAPKISNELEFPLNEAARERLEKQHIQVPNSILCSPIGFRQDDEYTIFGSSRYAYLPDGSRIIITRHIILQPSRNLLLIRDHLDGDGCVPYECNFLLAPQPFLMMRGDMGCRLVDRQLKARIIPYMPKKSFYRNWKANRQLMLGWYYAPNGTLCGANYLRYAHRELQLPTSVHFAIHWGLEEIGVPEPYDIDKIIESPKNRRQ